MRRSVSADLFTLSIILYCCSPSEAQDQHYKDSLQRALATAPDTAKMRLLVDLDNAWISINPVKSLEFEKDRLAIAEKLHDPHNQPAALISMSRAAIYLNDLPNAKAWLQKAYALAEIRNEKRLMALALINLGAVSQGGSDNAASLDYYLRAVRVTREIKDTPLTNIADGNIGVVYYSEGDYGKAEEYTLEVLPMIDSTGGDPQVLPKTMEELGNIYYKEKKLARASYYYKNALRIYTKQGNQIGIATTCGHIAGVYEDKPDSALYFAFMAKAIWDRVNPENFAAGENLTNIGSMYYRKAVDSLQPPTGKTNMLRKAEQYIQMGLQSALRTHRAEEMIYNYNEIAEIQAHLLEYKPAYENVVKSAQLNDSLYSQDEKNKLASLDEKYQVQQREDQLAANREALKIQKKQKYYLLACILFLAVIGMLLYWQNSTRKRLNNKLQTLNNNLLSLNHQLDEANEVKTRFVGILNHDLKGPVASLLNILHLQKESGPMDAPTASAHTERITTQAENLLETMEDMLSWSKGQMKNFLPQAQHIDVHDLIADIQNHFSGTPHLTIQYQAPENMGLYTDEYFLKTIMRNLTSNAIKNLVGQPDGVIRWVARKDRDKTVLTITDNGPGITEAQLKPLYDVSLPSTLRSGLGLHLVRDLSKAIGCEISVSSAPGTGTEFRLLF